MDNHSAELHLTRWNTLIRRLQPHGVISAVHVEQMCRPASPYGGGREETLALMVLFIKHHDPAPAALQRVWDAECFFCVRSLLLSFMCTHTHTFHRLIELQSRWHQCQRDSLICTDLVYTALNEAIILLSFDSYYIFLMLFTYRQYCTKTTYRKWADSGMIIRSRST